MEGWLPPKGGSLPAGVSGDGAFERFLTAAIAAIITIMFSWRLLDDMNDAEGARIIDGRSELGASLRFAQSTITEAPVQQKAPVQQEAEIEIDDSRKIIIDHTDDVGNVFCKPGTSTETDLECVLAVNDSNMPSSFNPDSVAQFLDSGEPRELDSDEELYCCSLLEPILEEDSDDILSSSDDCESQQSLRTHSEDDTDCICESDINSIVDENQLHVNHCREGRIIAHSSNAAENPRRDRLDTDDSESDESVQTVVHRRGSGSSRSAESSPVHDRRGQYHTCQTAAEQKQQGEQMTTGFSDAMGNILSPRLLEADDTASSEEGSEIDARAHSVSTRVVLISMPTDDESVSRSPTQGSRDCTVTSVLLPAVSDSAPVNMTERYPTYTIPSSPEIRFTVFQSSSNILRTDSSPVARYTRVFCDAVLSSVLEKTPLGCTAEWRTVQFTELKNSCKPEELHATPNLVVPSKYQDAAISSGMEETPTGYTFMRCEAEVSRREQRIFLVDRPFAPDFETFIAEIPFTSESITRAEGVGLLDNDDYSAFVKELSRSEPTSSGAAEVNRCILSGNLVSPNNVNAFAFEDTLPAVSSVSHGLADKANASHGNDSGKETVDAVDLGGSTYSKTESSEGSLDASFDIDGFDDKDKNMFALLQEGETVLCPNSGKIENGDQFENVLFEPKPTGTVQYMCDAGGAENEDECVQVPGVTVTCPSLPYMINVNGEQNVDVNEYEMLQKEQSEKSSSDPVYQGNTTFHNTFGLFSGNIVQFEHSVGSPHSAVNETDVFCTAESAVDKALTTRAEPVDVSPPRPRPRPRRSISSTDTDQVHSPVPQPLPRTVRHSVSDSPQQHNDSVTDGQHLSALPLCHHTDSDDDADISVEGEGQLLENEGQLLEDEGQLLEDEGQLLEDEGQLLENKQTPFLLHEEKRPKSLKEIRRKLAQHRTGTPTRPTISPFVVPDHMLTPSRFKILASRKRFFSSDSLHAVESVQEQFAHYKNSEPQPRERRYKPRVRPLSTSSSFSSQDQLERLQAMINWSRLSESSLDRPPIDHLHEGCIFTPEGRKDILNKTISIENLNLNLLNHLQKYGSIASLVTDIDTGETLQTDRFPETDLDAFDVLFQSNQPLQRSASMSDLYARTTRAVPEPAEPSSTRKTGKDRFMMHRYYKKSKSLCTLETNIDDVDGTGNEDNLKRVPSVHELRVTKSLLKLNVPDWFKQSSLSKSSSCLLKYGSNSTMNSFSFSPSLISSPCASTAPPATNVVIRTRVVPPSTTRSLRSPGLLASKSSSERKAPASPVKLPSEKFREKEKQKSLMPIPIVPFAQIRAMFEKKTKAERKTDSTGKEEKTDPLPAISITLEDKLDKNQTEGVNEENLSITLPVADRQSVAHSPPQALLKTNFSEPKQKISTTRHVINIKENELQEAFAVPADTNSVFPASVGTVASSRVEPLETSARLAQFEQQITRDAKDVRHKDVKSHSPTKSVKTFFGLSKEKHAEAKQQNCGVESSLSGDAIYESEPRRRGVGTLARRFEEGDVGSGVNSGFTSNSPNRVEGSRDGPQPPPARHEHRTSDSHMGFKTLPPIVETQYQAPASPENHHRESLSRMHPVVSSENGRYHRGDDTLAWTPVKSSGPRSVKETTV